MSSSRLAGKVLKPIIGKPMLARQIERIRRARRIDRIMVATSTDLSDDALQEVCTAEGILCFRGSLSDVLDRFYRAAESSTPAPGHIVRLTGDCPLADPGVIDDLIAFYADGSYDYASNALEPTFPDGLDAEVFSMKALRCAWERAVLPSQREHVTPYLYTPENGFRVGSYKNDTDYSALRWTVDEPQDFEFVKAVYEHLYPANPRFGMQDILHLLARTPELLDLNRHFMRNEGMLKSLKRDEEWISHHGTKKNH